MPKGGESMDSDEARNKAIWEVNNNLGPSNTTNLTAVVREKYETERTNQQALKQGTK
jgi:hypothetical protein